MTLTISFTWETTTPMGIHTGLARAGGVDQVVRARKTVDGILLPEIPGEAVKAVIREAAERILRWQGINKEADDPDRSIPKLPVLARLFARQWVPKEKDRSDALYFFRGTRGDLATEHEKMEQAGTKIDPLTGTAAHNTLRTVEAWKPKTEFQVQIRGENGNWSSGTQDHKDLCLLLMAIVCVDSVGGGWGIGRGGVKIKDLRCIIKNDELQEESIELEKMLQSDALAHEVTVWMKESK